MQQKHASKRLLALLLTMIMLLSSVTTMAWANEEDDGPYEPIIDYLDMLYYSPEPRPAEAFDLTFEFWGRPTHGYEFTAGGFSAELTFVDPDSYAVLHQETVAAKSLVSDQEDHYVATVEADASAWPNSRMIVTKLTIADTSPMHDWEEATNWEFDIAEGYSADISITGMSTDKNVVELSDANYDPVNGVIPETVKLTMELDVPAGFTIPTAGYDILFQIENDNEDFHSEHEVYGGVLSTDSNGKTYAEWTMDIGYFWGEGNYTINWVKYHDFSADPVYLSMNGNNIALRVDRSKISDKSAPAITDFYFSLNGVKQTEGGFRVKQTDTLKFHIAATDPAYIQDNTVGLMSEIFGECNLQATYDSAKGELICNVPVAYIDTTEWYMNYFHAADIYENIDAFSLGDDDDFDEMKHLYFFLEDADGGCAVNTYDATLCFHTNRLVEDEDGSGEWEVVEISLEDLPRIYSLSEVLGSQMPTADIPVDGLTFEGWYCPDTIQSYFTAADDTMFGEYSHVEFYPAYDQAWVEIVCSFINQDAARIWDSPVMDVVVPYGSTVQDVIDAFEAAGGVDHELYPGSVLSEWLCNDALDMPITPQTTGIALQPLYEKFPVFVNYGYMNAEGFYEYSTVEDEKLVFVAEGATLADVVKAAGLNDLPHYEGLQLLGWNTDGLDMDTEIGWGYEGAIFEAVYDKLPVRVMYGYWDENGEAIVGITAVLVNYGATYKDVVDAFHTYAATLEHWDEVNFAAWEDYTGCNPTEPVHPGFEAAFIANYDKTLPADWGVETSVMVYYYDENLNYDVVVIPYDEDADLTYSEMIAEGIKQVQHNSGLTLKEWVVGNYNGEPVDSDFLSKKAQAENVTIYVEPVYTDRVVTLSYSYLNEANKTVEDSIEVILPDGEITLDDVLAKVELPTDHSKECGFVEWSFWTEELDKTDYAHATAVYKKYPYNYTYTYMTQKGETETVTNTVLVDAGTSALAYFDTLTAPHTSNMTFKRWVLTKAPDYPVSEVSLWGRNLAVMAEYEQSIPVCVEFQELNDDLELVETQHICYVNGNTDNTDLDTLLNDAVMQAEPNVSVPDGFEIMGTGDMFEDYIPVNEDGTFFSGLHYKVWISYDKAVLYMHNPDDTITKVAVKEGEDYALPTTYNGKNVKWTGPVNKDGTVTVWGHITEVKAVYVVSCQHNLVKTAAKAATCTTAGNIEYYTCSECSKYFADKKGEKELTAADLAVKATNHNLVKVDAKAPTYTEDGWEAYEACSKCDYHTTKVVIPQLIKVEDEKAEVSEGAVNSAIEEAKKDNADEVTLDLTHKDVVGEENKDAVTEAKLPVAALESVAKEEKALTLVKEDATVTLDAKALAAVIGQADGESVTLKIQNTEVTTLKPAQQAAVKSKKVALTISAELLCDKTGEKLATKDGKGFGGGAATVAVPVPEKLPAGIKASDLKVYFVDDDGTMTHVSSKLVDGKIVFDLKHFSEYVIAADVPAAPATGDSFPMVSLIVAALVSAAGIFLLSRKSKRA